MFEKKHQEAPKGKITPIKSSVTKRKKRLFVSTLHLIPKRRDLSTIVLDGSGLIVIREIDAEAIIFKRESSFDLKFEDAKNSSFPFNDKARYKALSF